MEQSKLKKLLSGKNIALIVLFIVIIAFYSIASSVTERGVFLSLFNLRTILNSMVVVALLTIGAGCLMVSGDLDLSAGYVGTLCGVVLAYCCTNMGMAWPLALILSIVVGAVFGLFNAFLVNELHLPAFIATLATGYIAEGLSYALSGGGAITMTNPQLSWLGSGRIGSVIPVAIILAFALFIVYGVIMAKTKFGRSAYLVGGNRAAARLTGIKPKKVSYILFINSAALAALAGSLLTARLRSGTMQGIKASNFSGVTAAILGGISFGGGSGGLGGAFLGLLIINSFNNGMSVMQVSSYYQNIASGLLLVLALVFDYIATRRDRRKSALATKAQ